MFKARTYRTLVKNSDLVTFGVAEKETDLFISAAKNLSGYAREAVLNYRKDLDSYIKTDPRFYSSLEPVDCPEDAPGIVKAMAAASAKAGVGPMASVAGAMAEFVGRRLLEFSNEVIVENGGDIFLKTVKPKIVGIYAGEDSPFTDKLSVEIPPSDGSGICTSSGTVSHSLSFGKADAAMIICDDAALADAVATATCNMVKTDTDIERAMEFAGAISGVNSVLVIMGKKVGVWGDIKLRRR